MITANVEDLNTRSITSDSYDAVDIQGRRVNRYCEDKRI